MVIPDPGVVGLELRMLGTIISAIAYGMVITLSGNCFLLLQKKRGIYSNRMRLFLLIYVTVMLLLSTLAIIQSICGITLITFHRDQETLYKLSIDNSFLYALVENTISTLPLTIWGADGFMIWRCVVLYQDVARGPKIFGIVLLSLLSLGCGVMMFLDLRYSVFALWLVVFSTLVNITLALLVILRLVHHQRHIRKVLGPEHGSRYSKVITMCVESSALIVIFDCVYIVLGSGPGRTNGPAIFPFLLLPHICVISPLLIVYRVAEGRAMATTLQTSERETAQIRFNNPPSSLSSSCQGGRV